LGRDPRARQGLAVDANEASVIASPGVFSDPMMQEVAMQTASRTIFGKGLERPTREPRLQSGVLAYRIGAHGKVRVLLVRTRRSKHWSIPKGGVQPALSLPENAAKEAFEEAGVRGEVDPCSAGMFRTTKHAWYGAAIIEIWVYLLRVTEQLKRFPEQGQREIKWVSCRTAAKMLHEPLLAELCRNLHRKALS
jgi:8-oxo-dGTP pyrophosphatase MutT (NUDIX family)